MDPRKSFEVRLQKICAGRDADAKHQVFTHTSDLFILKITKQKNKNLLLDCAITKQTRRERKTGERSSWLVKAETSLCVHG